MIGPGMVHTDTTNANTYLSNVDSPYVSLPKTKKTTPDITTGFYLFTHKIKELVYQPARLPFAGKYITFEVHVETHVCIRNGNATKRETIPFPGYANPFKHRDVLSKMVFVSIVFLLPGSRFRPYPLFNTPPILFVNTMASKYSMLCDGGFLLF
jgi:hypothetical protein